MYQPELRWMAVAAVPDAESTGALTAGQTRSTISSTSHKASALTSTSISKRTGGAPIKSAVSQREWSVDVTRGLSVASRPELVAT